MGTEAIEAWGPALALLPSLVAAGLIRLSSRRPALPEARGGRRGGGPDDAHRACARHSPPPAGGRPRQRVRGARLRSLGADDGLLHRLRPKPPGARPDAVFFLLRPLSLRGA